LNVAIKEVLMN